MAILLATACLFILRPFAALLTWGIIIAVSAYPSFRRLQAKLAGRRVLAAVIFASVLLALLIVPVILPAGTLAEGVQTFAAHFKDGTLLIPPPPASVEHWPIIGAPVNRVWSLASKDLAQALKSIAPQIKAAVPSVFAASAAIGLTVLQFALSIIVAGALLANAEAAYEVTCSLAKRLFGKQGPEFQQLIGATIRSVTTGILGVVYSRELTASRDYCGDTLNDFYHVVSF